MTTDDSYNGSNSQHRLSGQVSTNTHDEHFYLTWESTLVAFVA